MKSTNTTKRSTKSITEVEFVKLIDGVRQNKIIRENTRVNMLRTYVILYYTGLRLGEVRELRIKNIKELIETGTTKIILSKTSKERELYITENFKKELKKLFDFNIEEDENWIICKGSDKKTRPGSLGYISMINKNLKEILGEEFTSHSFRKGFITEMFSKGLSIEMIRKCSGHSNTNTTLSDLKPTFIDIKNCLVR